MGSPLPGRAMTFKARGLSDAKDATNAPPGAMQSLSNLIPDPSTKHLFTPRPAAAQLSAFAGSGLNTPAQVNELLTVGAIAYGFCADTAGTFNGKDVPFAFNMLTQTFETVSIPEGAASLPTTPATVGDWTPPCMQVVAGRVMATHPGFAGGAGPFFGWLDVSGFTDNTHTGATHTTKTIDGLSANVLQAGWMVGMAIAGAGIPANTVIKTIAGDGLSLTLSNAATATAAGVALAVAGGTAVAPLWSSGNTNGNTLSAVPVWVQGFNGRAWFGLGAGSVFSDAGSPCQVTNATQAILFRNGLATTAAGGLGLFSSTVGGIIQSLMVFQGDAQIWQVQGDVTFAAGLTVNALNQGIGTQAPNTVTATPIGLSFVAPDGVRLIDASGKITDPIGQDGEGVVVPFLYAISPSRMTSAFNQGVLRLSVKNGKDPNQATQEYWLDFTRKIWTGPHTFPAAQIAPMQLATNSFIVAGVGINAKLFQSDVTPSVNAGFTENGVALSWQWLTCLLPDNEDMSENAVVESAIAMMLSPGSAVTVLASDELGNILAQVVISGPAGSPELWDVAQWDVAIWDGASGIYQQYPIPWPQVLVFKQMQIQVNGMSMLGMSIGNCYYRVEHLEFQMQAAGGRV